MRFILAVVFAFAVAASFSLAPMSTDANAATKFKNKMCTGTALDNKKVNFKCKASEKCCFDALAGKGTCGAATAACF